MTAQVRQSGQDAAAEARRAAGAWLRGLREARGLSQRQLAQRLGIEFYSFIAQIEAGRGRIPPERYEAWAEALGLEPCAFVRDVLRHYEPVTWRILFGEEERSPRSAPAPGLRTGP
jgi:transcriptional regulator with XRE-family HTH domain